jgi:type 1 glutamine amidotransferase
MFLFFLSAIIAQSAEPLRALLITGGCCHDYEAQKKILTEGISARANVTWTILHEGDGNDNDLRFSVYEKPNWTKGFDVIVHNECSGKVTDVPFIESIARAHSNGVPAVVIHCSMHSYRDAETDEWRKFLGVSSYRHQQHVAFEVKNLKPEHPVMKGFPASWKTPNGELYEIEKLWPNCVPLGEAYGKRSGKNHTCIWVNTYGKARVFGTTIGHFNEEMDNDTYLGLITRGLLWACDKLDKNGEPKKGFGKK